VHRRPAIPSLISLSVIFTALLPSPAASTVIFVPVAASEVRNLKVAAPSDLTDLHKIALVAPALDKVVVQHLGLRATLTGGGISDTDVTDWKLADVALEAARTVLKPPFEVYRPDFRDDDPFAEIDREPMTDASKPLERIVRAMPETGADAYLLLLPSAEPFSGSSTYLIGAGVDRVPALFKARPEAHYGEADIHLFYEAYLVRARDGKVIALSTGEQPHKKAGVDIFPREWSGRMSWSAKAQSMTEDERTVLRDKLTELIERSLPYTLTRMGLAPAATP
jgi:hypothetical protein